MTLYDKLHAAGRLEAASMITQLMAITLCMAAGEDRMPRDAYEQLLTTIMEWLDYEIDQDDNNDLESYEED